jgi:protease-4
MLRFPVVLVRNILTLLAYLWSMFLYTVGYSLRRKKKLFVAWMPDASQSFGPPPGMASYFQATPSFLETWERVERLKASSDIDGLIMECDATAGGLGTTASLTAMVDRAREASQEHPEYRDLQVLAHTRMTLLNDYLLATAADEIFVSPSSRLYTFGPRFDQVFAADAIDRLGIRAQMVHIGEFKTAAHRLIHDEMTDAQRLMMGSLHEDLLDSLRRRIAARREVEPDEVDALFADAPLDGEGARRQQLVDHALFRHRLIDWIHDGNGITPGVEPVARWEPEHAEPPPEQPEETSEPSLSDAVPDAPWRPDGDEDVLVVDFEDADAVMKPQLDWKPLVSAGPTLATVDLSGMIVSAGMQVPGRQAVIDPDRVLPVLADIRRDPSIAGLLMHINSPGGSAPASDLLWEAIQRTRREIPVVAYCTDVVGSGGYYLASAADRIITHRVTLTGSIGVVTGKVSAEAVPDKVGVNVDSIYEYPADTFTSLVHPLDESMMENMNEGARSFYRRFLQRVGQSRDLPRRRLHRYARGRIYMGEQAHKRGLVDELGDFSVAHDRLCEMTQLSHEDVELSHFNTRAYDWRSALGLGVESLSGWIADSLSGDAAAALDVFSNSGIQQQASETALATRLLQRESALALMPEYITTSADDVN